MADITPMQVLAEAARTATMGRAEACEMLAARQMEGLGAAGFEITAKVDVERLRAETLASMFGMMRLGAVAAPAGLALSWYGMMRNSHVAMPVAATVTVVFCGGFSLMMWRLGSAVRAFARPTARDRRRTVRQLERRAQARAAEGNRQMARIIAEYKKWGPPR